MSDGPCLGRGQTPRPPAVTTDAAGAVRPHSPHLDAPAERRREHLACAVARRLTDARRGHLAEHLAHRSGQLELLERPVAGQRTHVLVVDMQVGDRGRRCELRRRVKPEPVEHEVVQRLDLLGRQPGVLVEELAQAAFAARLLEPAVPLRRVALTQEAAARALDALLVAIAESPARPCFVSYGFGVRAIVSRPSSRASSQPRSARTDRLGTLGSRAAARVGGATRPRPTGTRIV